MRDSRTKPDVCEYGPIRRESACSAIQLARKEAGADGGRG